jgi:hypothetical protein
VTASLPSGTAEPIRKIYQPASNFRTQEGDPANMWSLKTPWRAVLGQCAPSPQVCRHTPAQSRAAGGPRRDYVPQAQTVQTCVSAGAPAAKLRPTNCQRYITARANLQLYRQSRIYLLCPAVQLPSCSSPVATAALANCNEHVAEADISRPHPPTPCLL